MCACALGSISWHFERTGNVGPDTIFVCVWARDILVRHVYWYIQFLSCIELYSYVIITLCFLFKFVVRMKRLAIE